MFGLVTWSPDRDWCGRGKPVRIVGFGRPSSASEKDKLTEPSKMMSIGNEND